MDVLALALSAAMSLLFLALVFRPLEIAFPARAGQKFFRPAWFTDLCFFAGQYLLWSGLVVWALSFVGVWIDEAVPGSFRLMVASQPWWLQAIEVILLSDFLIYWGHRLQHRVGFLWRFHSVHHSSEHLDWLAAHREHPLDSIYTVGLINLPAILLGFPIETLIGFITFRGLWAVYIHSNVRLPIGPLAKLLGSPQIHHWHHDRDRDAGNYANLSPLMDIIFGTYHCPDHEPEAFGLHETASRNYLAHMIKPLLPAKLYARLSSRDAVAAGLSSRDAVAAGLSSRDAVAAGLSSRDAVAAGLSSRDAVAAGLSSRDARDLPTSPTPSEDLGYGGMTASREFATPRATAMFESEATHALSDSVDA